MGFGYRALDNKEMVKNPPSFFQELKPVVASLSAREFTSFSAPTATGVLRKQVGNVGIGESGYPTFTDGLKRAWLAARHNGESVTSNHQKPPLTDQNAALQPEAAHPLAGRGRTFVLSPGEFEIIV